MLTHPLVIALLTVELLGALFLVDGTLGALKIIHGWQPSAPSRKQLALERRTESVSIEGNFSLILAVTSLILLVIAVTLVLPGQIKGAMCGMGVVESTRGSLSRAFAFKLLALAFLFVWRQLDVFRRSHPTAPLAVYSSRVFLVASTLVFFSTLNLLIAFSSHTTDPVDCCSAVYDTIGGNAASHGPLFSQKKILVFYGLASALFLTMATFSALRPRSKSFPVAIPLSFGLTGLLWILLSAYTLVEVLGSYHYGVLHHACPYCLFLPEHNFVGYLLYGALTVVGVSSLTIATAALVRQHLKLLDNIAARRIRRATFFSLLSTLFYLALSLGPAILWRMEYGVWIDGF